MVKKAIQPPTTDGTRCTCGSTNTRPFKWRTYQVELLSTRNQQSKKTTVETFGYVCFDCWRRWTVRYA